MTDVYRSGPARIALRDGDTLLASYCEHRPGFIYLVGHRSRGRRPHGPELEMTLAEGEWLRLRWLTEIPR